jgi:two-component system sensor histidine kinase KdpD
MAAAVAAVTGVVYALDDVAPVVSLGALYLFAVLPVAVLWGLPYAVATSVLSMLVFNFLFLPPLYTFTLADSQNWVALAIYLVTAVVVSELASRLRQRAADAEQREREEAILAELATAFLTGRDVTSELDSIAERAGEVLGAEHARIELGPQREPLPGRSPYELRAGDQHVGTLYLEEGPASNLAVRRRFLPALASLLAVAIERERLAEEALEAEALRRSDTIKTAVLRAVSHDLQSPLTAIITAAGSLASHELTLEPADREELVDTIQVEAVRLERLVRDLLDLSRLEAGAAQPSLELWTVDELVSQALEDLGPASDRVDVVIPHEIPPVRVDAGQVRRALANLLENAVKFSPADELVSVRASATRKEVIIRVVDRGPGLSPD